MQARKRGGADACRSGRGEADADTKTGGARVPGRCPGAPGRRGSQGLGPHGKRLPKSPPRRRGSNEHTDVLRRLPHRPSTQVREQPPPSAAAGLVPSALHAGVGATVGGGADNTGGPNRNAGAGATSKGTKLTAHVAGPRQPRNHRPPPAKAQPTVRVSRTGTAARAGPGRQAAPAEHRYTAGMRAMRAKAAPRVLRHGAMGWAQRSCTPLSPPGPTRGASGRRARPGGYWARFPYASGPSGANYYKARRHNPPLGAGATSKKRAPGSGSLTAAPTRQGYLAPGV
jgi:hypothetical protein